MIFIILLLQLCYIPNYIKKLLQDAPFIKNLDGMIIMLVPREKSRKVICVLNGTEMLSPKATTNKNMPSPTLSKKQLTIICQKKRQNTYLVTDEIIYSPPHPYITHPTPPLHHPPHPTPPHPPLHDPSHPTPT